MLLAKGKVQTEYGKKTRGECLFGVYVMSKVGDSGGGGDNEGQGVALPCKTIMTNATLNMLRHTIERNAHYMQN